MPRKPRIPLENRFKAIDLLAGGRTKQEVISEMQKHHPGLPAEQVERHYFPKTGFFAISGLEGKPPAKANAVKKRITEQLAAHSERSRERMKQLHKDPVFAAANSERMKQLNKDPEFRRNVLNGIAKYWNTYWLRLQWMFEELGISGAGQWKKTRAGSRKVPVAAIAPAQATGLMLKERSRIIARALSSLKPLERQVVDLVFGFSDRKNPLNVNEAAEVLNVSENRVSLVLKSALGKLASIRGIRELR